MAKKITPQKYLKAYLRVKEKYPNRFIKVPDDVWYSDNFFPVRTGYFGTRYLQSKPDSVYQKYYRGRVLENVLHTPEGMKRYAQVMGVQQPEEKKPFNFFKRLTAGLTAQETAPAVYKALYGKGKPTALTYPKEIGKKLKTVATGEGEEPITYEKILEKEGMKKGWGRTIAGIGLDIVLDPLTYETFGIGAATKGIKIGGKVLSKAGQKALKKEVVARGGTQAAEKAARTALEQLAKKSPKEFAKKYVSKGGLKFMGKTIVPGTEYKNILKQAREGKAFKPTIGYKAKEAIRTQPLMESLAKTFKRDVRPKGALPWEWRQLKELAESGYYSKKAFKAGEALGGIKKIGRVSAKEGKEISRAIATNTVERLPARTATKATKFRQYLDDIYKTEQKAGIEYKSVRSYIPHIFKNPKAGQQFLKYIQKTKPSETVRFAKHRIFGDLTEVPRYVLGNKKIANNESWDILLGKQGSLSDGTTYKEARKVIDEAGLMPELNIEKLAAIRGTASARGVTGREFNKEIAEKFGISPTFKVYRGKRIAKQEAHNALRGLVSELYKKGKGMEAEAIKESRFGIKAGKTPQMFTKNILKTLNKEGVIGEGELPVLKKIVDDYLKEKKLPVESFYSNETRRAIKMTPVNLADTKVLIPDWVAEYIGGLDKFFIERGDVGALLKGYDKTLNVFKRYWTSVFPAFHARNAASNVVFNTLDVGVRSLDPQQIGRSLKVLLTKGGDEVVKTKTGVKYTLSEIKKLAKEHDVLKSGFQYGDFGRDASAGLANELGRRFRKYSPMEWGKRVGYGLESQARIQNFITNLQKGLNPAEAAARTKQFLFDYDNLSRFEKNVMKRVFPFYTFTRKNAGLQVALLVSEPGKTAALLKAIRQVGEPLSDEERSYLPDWIQEKLAVKAKGKDEYGRPMVYAGLQTPIEEFTELFQGGLTKKPLSMLSPAMKVPIELGTKTEIFRQRPIEEISYADELQWAYKMPKLKEWLDLRRRKRKVYVNGKDTGKEEWTYTANPWKLWLIRNFPTSRFQSTLGYAVQPKYKGKEAMLKMLTGLRRYSIDEEQAQYFKSQEELEKMQQLLQRYGYLGGTAEGGLYMRQPQKTGALPMEQFLKRFAKR